MHVKVTYLFFLSSGSKEHGPILMLRQSEAHVVSPLLNLCLIQPSLCLHCTHVLGRKVAPGKAREHNALKHGHMLVLKTRHFDRASGQIPRALADNRVFFLTFHDNIRLSAGWHDRFRLNIQHQLIQTH